jgi:uncharacterized membrane protein YfcA
MLAEVIEAAPVAAAAASQTARTSTVVVAAVGVLWCWYNRGRDWQTAVIFTVLGMLIQYLGFQQFFDILSDASTGVFNLLSKLG